MKKYFSIILITLFCINTFAQNNDEPEREKEVKSSYKGVAYRGFSLHADIAAPIMEKLILKNALAFEIQADVNLYDKIFPIFEVGFGTINSTLNNGSSYKTASPFFRIGLNYSLLKNINKDGTPKIIHSYPFLGLRYGFNILPYQIDNVQINSDYWGETQMVNFGEKAVFAGWGEIVGGVRIDIKNGFTMGWSVRAKMLFHASKNKTQLWYVSGYGLTSGSNFSFNYTIGYTFKTKAEKEKANTIKK
ncbi:MAG: DUF6048 family protein [Prevotellaceae bacterium]|jgi:hypothetical protein|nr:DUF6048 family protein [Prevotellaceae bacterium]